MTASSLPLSEYLVDNLNADPDVPWLLDFIEILPSLVTNPEGQKHGETSLL